MLSGAPLLEPSRPDIPGSEVKTAPKLSNLPDETPSTDIRKMISFVGAAYFLFMTVIVVPIAGLSIVTMLYPIKFFNLKLYNKLEHQLCRMVNNHWVTAAVYCGMTVTEFGDDISKLSEKRVLFLANHLGLLDHFVIMQSLHDKGSVSGRWMWIIFNIWKYTPLGALWLSHGNFFINGGASRREALLKDFRKHISSLFWKYGYTWMVMYPEGSRLFLIKESAAKFAEKLGLKPLKHCAHPRTGAALVVMDVLAPKQGDNSLSRSEKGGPIEYIIDATIGYPRGDVPDMGSAMMGDWPQSDSHQISINYSIHKVLPEWANEEKLKDFLYERYEEKDKILDKFYRTGTFSGAGRPVIIPQQTMAFAQLFWMASYYVNYTFWIRPLMVYAFTNFMSLVGF